MPSTWLRSDKYQLLSCDPVGVNKSQIWIFAQSVIEVIVPVIVTDDSTKISLIKSHMLNSFGHPVWSEMNVTSLETTYNKENLDGFDDDSRRAEWGDGLAALREGEAPLH